MRLASVPSDLRSARGGPALLVCALALALSSGCVADADGDGLSNQEELDLGTDPENPDSDGDGLEDGAERNEHGTDPLVADTDCDGFGDKAEIDDQTDPFDALSYDRDTPGRWPDLRCHVLEGELEGYGPAARVPDVQGIDQFGNNINLHQFYGNVVVLNMSAGWCSVCRDAAIEVEELYDDFKDRGLVVIHTMTDDDSRDGEISDQEFIGSWAETFAITSPVTDNGEALYTAFRDKGYNVSNSMPFFIVLGRDLRPRQEYSGWSEDGFPIGEDYLDTVLEQPPPWR